MVGSFPPRDQLGGEAVAGLSKLAPTSNVGFGKKLHARTVGGYTIVDGWTATDRSSMTKTPVMDAEPPETREQRIVTAPHGTASDPFRLVNVEFAMVLTHPGLLVPEVTKWVALMTLLLTSKNSTVKRISGPLRLYI